MKKLLVAMYSSIAKFLIIAIIYCASPFNSNAQYSKLLNFDGAVKGSSPQGSLVSDGTFLYGMTYNGGINDLGTIFKIKPDGSGYFKLLDFAGTANGSNPYGSLISDGIFLYGTTSTGGINDLGTIFKIKPDGSMYSKLLDFDGTANGSNPRGSLISDGTFLYGMTYNGGINDLGTIFKIKPDGSGYLKVLDFTGAANGSNPESCLLSDGIFLYGMTYLGGTNDLGVIFKIKPDGTSYSKLLDFSGASNGSYPLGSLISDGVFLYGMTYQGGINDLGIIFKIKPDGTDYLTLLDFSGASDGSYSFGSLISDGAFLYGMTFQGGTNDLGVIFKIKPDGTGYSKLLDCSGAANGSYPIGSLISDGTFLYGMTSGGGTNDLGTVFNFQLPAAITAVATGFSNACGGSNGTVSYTTGGAFNAGNIFIAQLSDASGSFSAPVNIGSLNSTVDGTIACTMPSTTPAGTGYRVRVVSTDPVIISNDNGTDITIKTTPVIATTTPASRCDTGTVILSATASAGTLDWYDSFSGGISLGTGTNFTTPTLSLTTTYYVAATDNGCISERTAVTATVTLITTTSPASRCDTGAVTLGATANAGTLNWYDFSSGGILLGTGISFTTPSLSSTTTYYVDVTNAGCTSTRTAVSATINPLPLVIANATNDTVCAGNIVILTGGGASSYLWSGGVTDGTGFVPSATTTYTVTGTDGSGCTNTFTIEIIVNPLPVINTSGNSTICTGSSTILTASGGINYMWDPVGQTASTITISPTISATYTVTVLDTNGCSDTSTLTVTLDPCTGISAIYSGPSVVIYPNPFLSTATVILTGWDMQSGVNMAWFDALGREIKNLDIIRKDSLGEAGTFEINRENLPAGIYYYRIYDAGGAFNAGKIMIE